MTKIRSSQHPERDLLMLSTPHLAITLAVSVEDMAWHLLSIGAHLDTAEYRIDMVDADLAVKAMRSWPS